MTRRTAASCSGSMTTAITEAGPTASDESIPVEIIALEGEFDLSNVRQLEDAIDQGIAAGARDFIADLSAVDFLDGRSVHALRDGWKRAARRNGQLVLV